MKKNLSILIYSLASGGAERVVSILLEELKDKYHITLVLMNKTIFYNIPKEINTIYLEKSDAKESGLLKLFKLPFLGLKYKNICKQYNIKISLSLMNRPNYINILSKLFGSNAKTIISERSMPSLEYSSGFKGAINRLIIKSFYPYSDIVMANSYGNTNDLENNFSVSKVITMHNPIDIPNIQQLSKDQSNIEFDGFSFITIGRLDKGKNHKLLISVMKHFNAKLYIIGDGELKIELEKQIIALGLEEKVFLLGMQVNPYKYLAKADCFLFSSLHEGFPNVLLEALACGLVIISSDCPSGPREILSPSSDFSFQLNQGIEKSKYGLLVLVNNEDSLHKAMSEVIHSEELREKYKNIALKRANSFSKEFFIEKIKKILKEEEK